MGVQGSLSTGVVVPNLWAINWAHQITWLRRFSRTLNIMENADKVIFRVSLFAYEKITDNTFLFHRNARLHIAKLNRKPGISDEEMIAEPSFKLPRSELQRINKLILLKNHF